MIIETSKDVLYLVIAFCIIWVTVFLCWMFYYVAKILRAGSEIVEEFRVKLQALSDAINHVRNKVEIMSDIFTLGTSGVGGMFKKMATKNAKKAVDKSTKNLNKVAKAAVDKAVKATAKKAKKVAKKMKKK